MPKKKETYWNYRLYEKEFCSSNGEKWTECGIIEVYYEGKKIKGYTDSFMYPFGESAEEAKEDLLLMSKAFEKPVLTIKDLEPKKTKAKKVKKKNEKSKR